MTHIKVALVQFFIPHYRIPLFARLGQNPVLDLRVFHSPVPQGIGFKEESPGKEFKNTVVGSRWLAGKRLVWQDALCALDGLRAGDVLVINGNPRMLHNYPLTLRARRRGIGVLWWGIGFMPGSSWINTQLRRRIMKSADCLLLYSDIEADEFRKFGFIASRVFGANNTIDQSDIQAARAKWPHNRLSAFIREHQLENRKIILYCTRLIKERRLDWVISALKLLVSKDPAYLLVVIGDGSEKHRFQECAESLGVTSSIRWMGSIYDQEQLAPWYLTASSMPFPTQVGLHIFHAFGYGLPIVLSDNLACHSSELAAFSPGINGLYYRDGDIASLAETIDTIASNESLRARLSHEAFRTVSEVFTLEHMCDKFSQAILESSRVALARMKRIKCH